MGTIITVLPRALEQSLHDLEYYISTQNWDSLSHLYHPAYRGHRGAARYLSAHEEMIRLRAEIDQPGAVQRSCKITPLVSKTMAEGTRVTVAERLEVIWQDGCRTVTRRQLEHYWSCFAGRWMLTRTERIPRTESGHREAPMMHEVLALLDWIEDVLETQFSPFLIRRAAKALRDSSIAARLSIALDVRGLRPWAAEALQRACHMALELWNQTLDPLVKMYPHSGTQAPDILIHGYNRLLPGGSLGVTISETHHRSRWARAKFAELYISTLERAAPDGISLSPGDLFHTLCHELGHCLGLDDCSHGGIMTGCVGLQGELPTAPFEAERRAVFRRLERQHRLVARACRELGEDGQAEIEAQKAAVARAESDLERTVANSMNYQQLIENSYAPPAVQYYWEGNSHFRRRHYDQALECYNRALAEGQDQPELWLRRGLAQRSFRAGLADIHRAVDADPGWLLAHEALVDILEKVGRGPEAVVHQERISILSSKARLQEILFLIGVSRGVEQRCSAALRATGCAVSYLLLLLRQCLAGRRASVYESIH